MVQAIAAFMDFCYIVRQYSLDEQDLEALQNALERFETHRSIFQTCGVRPSGISIPRIHALQHYKELIQLFGAPNGLCSSITESKHITAVKKPYRRSNRNEALYQILVINQRLDNLAAFRNAHNAEGTVIIYVVHLMVIDCDIIGLFNMPLIAQAKSQRVDEDQDEMYEEPECRDDIHLDEVEAAEESSNEDDEDHSIEAWVKLAKIPSKIFLFIVSQFLKFNST